MKVPGAAGLAQWAREHTRAFHRSLWDFCNDQFFFVEAISPAGFPVSLSHGYNMQGGRMTVSTLILILAADLYRGWRSRALKIDINQIASR